jgi:hypothetical protein
MRRRSFLVGALSTGTVILTQRRSPAAELETWRSYNTGRFEQVRGSLSRNNQRWIDVDLRRMRVTALVGNQIQVYQGEQLSFLCDDGDVYNPTITGHFSIFPRIVALKGFLCLEGSNSLEVIKNTMTS